MLAPFVRVRPSKSRLVVLVKKLWVGGNVIIDVKQNGSVVLALNRDGRELIVLPAVQ